MQIVESTLLSISDGSKKQDYFLKVYFGSFENSADHVRLKCAKNASALCTPLATNPL